MASSSVGVVSPLLPPYGTTMPQNTTHQNLEQDKLFADFDETMDWLNQYFGLTADTNNTAPPPPPPKPFVFHVQIPSD